MAESRSHAQLENTLLDGSRRPLVKICDFGYSKHLRQDSLPKSKVGTPGYTGGPRAARITCRGLLTVCHAVLPRQPARSTQRALGR